MEIREVVSLSNNETLEDSRVKGKIPEGWKIARFRDVFTFSKGLNITKENLEEEGIPCVNYGEIHSKYGFEVNPKEHPLKCVSEEFLVKSPKSLLQYGDFIFADTSEDIEGSGNFTYLNSHETTFAGYHTVITRLKRKESNHRFLAYVIDSMSFRSQVRRKVKGVKVYSITNAILKDTTLWFPPHAEQSRIVDFLDQKTSQIDQAVSKKERLIELLKERRQIMIHKAVTQGLNADAKMKDSGVDWVGEIPEHWTLLRAKFIFDEIDDRSASGIEELLSVSHMTGVTPRSEKNVSMFMAEDYSGSKLCAKGDLVINIMWAWMGALGVSDRVGIVSPSYGVFRQKKKVMNSWYLEQLLGDTDYVAEYNRRSTGLHSSRLRLYADYFFDMAIGFPSLEEQREIEKHVSNQTDKIDNAIARTEQEIEKLKEYRTSLINSAVTGKIKV